MLRARCRELAKREKQLRGRLLAASSQLAAKRSCRALGVSQKNAAAGRRYEASGQPVVAGESLPARTLRRHVASIVSHVFERGGGGEQQVSPPPRSTDLTPVPHRAPTSCPHPMLPHDPCNPALPLVVCRQSRLLEPCSDRCSGSSPSCPQLLPPVTAVSTVRSSTPWPNSSRAPRPGGPWASGAPAWCGNHGHAGVQCTPPAVKR